MSQTTGEYNINLYSGCSDEVKFVYKKYFDKPENHFMHINKYCEIYIFIDGEANYIVEDLIFSLKRGDIVVITPYEVHKALLQREGPYERFYFLIPIDAFGYMNLDPMNNIFEKIKTHKNIISLTDEKRQDIIGILYEMVSLLRDKSANDLLVYSLFLKFIDIINKNLNSSNDSYVVKNLQQFPKILRDILQYIDKNLTDIKTAAEIADHFHISAPYLSSLFKSYTNIGIKNYIQLKKIGYAKILLDSGRNVTETCYESGFCSCSYFIKTFKKYNGITPLAYSAKNSEKNAGNKKSG